MLEARNITIKYGTRVAISELSLNLRQAEVTAIVGPNGAGKSTLLQALNGRITPVAGEVVLNGRSIRQFARRSIARQIAVVAQEVDVRFPLTVLEFVLAGRYAWANARGWGWETERDLEIAEDVLEETELGSLRNRLMNELSGGERQRAVLGRALATEAKILLLDEPTANLDLAHQATILSLVRSRCDTRNAAAVVITHDVNLAAEFADNILLLDEGRSVDYGTPARVFTPARLGSVFGIRVLVDAHPISGVPRITPVHEPHR